jgi:hypothetical protein
MNISRLSVVALTTAVLFGCAADIVRSSVRLDPTPQAQHTQIEIANDVKVQSSSGYRRALPSGSKWELRGSLPQGQVYKRVNAIFTVEGAHVHEAFIVINANQLVGFYLPVEQQFSPAESVSITLQ